MSEHHGTQLDERFRRLPASLASQTRFVRLGAAGVPALLAHPDWMNPAPTMIWLHGRTVDKQLDPGRYLRWIRAGIAACAIDLPGHGERYDAALQVPLSTPKVLSQVVGEIDQVVEALADPAFDGVFDLDRVGLGGMSAGGMATLRRLSDPHPFKAGAVESTAGDLGIYYASWGARETPARELIERIDPSRRVDAFRPIPLLALHSRADRTVPVIAIEAYLQQLSAHYERNGVDPALIRLHTWPTTGAPDEHNGFGLVAAEAKTIQTEFLARHLAS